MDAKWRQTIRHWQRSTRERYNNSPQAQKMVRTGSSWMRKPHVRLGLVTFLVVFFFFMPNSGSNKGATGPGQAVQDRSKVEKQPVRGYEQWQKPQAQRKKTSKEIEGIDYDAQSTHSPANSTLNFQKIFAVNLPERLDRLDFLTMLGRFSDLDISISPGVRGFSEHALPFPKTPGKLRAEEYAVHRAHANVWRQVIEGALTTALVLEDDNDWDVNIKDILPHLLRTLNYKLENDKAIARGQGWDILWLGACYETSRTDEEWVIVDGEEANVPQKNYNWVNKMLRTYLPEYTPPQRILQRARAARCMNAYAISQRGAKRLLYFTNQFLDDRLDIAIMELVNQGRLDGFSIIPPVFVQYKVTANPSKDNDMGYDVWPIENRGFVKSTRAALKKAWSPAKFVNPPTE